MQEQKHHERPKPFWAPIPLSEFAIAVGVVLLMSFFFSQGSVGAVFAGVGLVLVTVGTLELVWREHRSGYRSHAALIAAILVFPCLFIVGSWIGRYQQFTLLFGGLLWVLLWKLLKNRFLAASKDR